MLERRRGENKKDRKIGGHSMIVVTWSRIEISVTSLVEKGRRQTAHVVYIGVHYFVAV